MNTQRRCSAECQERAVRLVEEQQKEGSTQWAAMRSILKKLGCTPATLRRWVRQWERDQGKRAGLMIDERACLKQLEKENREPKCANDIFRTASAYFAQAELERRRN